MQNTTTEKILLTEYAHGAGCGCKIAPQVLSQILATQIPGINDEKLLVGNESNDDAAVYDLGNGSALISTTDFFMPIVDDAFDFGRVAAANAISDVYAMGGTPILALAILGWPINKLSPEIAQRVIEGARAVCAEAKITLAGGHSIDTLEPMFGLSVNGTVLLENLKKNDTANEGDLIYMTKPLGTGILATAKKRKVLLEADETALLQQLTRLNSIGEILGKLESVTAMTDITGFGLLGHLMEMARGSDLTAEINYSLVPKISNVSNYIGQAIVPDATYRNWNAYSKDVELTNGVNAAEAFMILPDPQTNGGLLFTVKSENRGELEKILQDNHLEMFAKPIGKMLKREEKIIKVLN